MANADKEISYCDLKGLKEKNKDLLIVDVRSKDEVDRGHIPGSIHIPVEDVEKEFSLDTQNFQEKFGVPKPQLDSRDLVFHCQMGRRGEVATEKARKLGFINARNYTGGYKECRLFISVVTMAEIRKMDLYFSLCSSFRKFLQKFGNMPDAKSDMERVGLFKEMGYMSIGDKYRPSISGRSKYYYTKSYCPFNEAAYKNKQMLVSGPKKKSALQAGYFDTQFKRIFENEALTDFIKIQRQYQIQQAKKNLTKAFLSSIGEKKSSGVGSYYGTLGGPVKAMSSLEIPKKAYKSPGKNMYTSPAKKGSGYGFPDVTLSKLELYSSDPYDRVRELLKREMAAHRSKMKGGPFRLNLHPQECFDSNPYKLNKPQPLSNMPGGKKTHFAVPFKPSSPSKRTGGMKAGTFGPYPSHSTDPYIIKKLKSDSVSANKGLKIFHPSPGPKSTPVKSLISLNVNSQGRMILLLCLQVCELHQLQSSPLCNVILSGNVWSKPFDDMMLLESDIVG
ncbi:hypothetical protein QTP86_022794 [Hemibagrus guttatus]|nr:hypothetical protein QTP86_022794 [Hemibagrus guttatus]